MLIFIHYPALNTSETFTVDLNDFLESECEDIMSYIQNFESPIAEFEILNIVKN